MARKMKKKVKAKPAKRTKKTAKSTKARRPAKKKVKRAKPTKIAHPGMMGDGTEEQNLNQPGNPRARITRGEVASAFANPKN